MKTEDIALFHRIVETGSLVDAANILNLPKSTVSRRLQTLEDDLHVKLFHRQSRSFETVYADAVAEAPCTGVGSPFKGTADA